MSQLYVIKILYQFEYSSNKRNTRALKEDYKTKLYFLVLNDFLSFEGGFRGKGVMDVCVEEEDQLLSFLLFQFFIRRSG